MQQLGSGRALQLLSVQHFALQLREELAGANERLGYPPVPAPVAGGYEVSYAAGLEESVLSGLGVNPLNYADHLHEAC